MSVSLRLNALQENIVDNQYQGRQRCLAPTAKVALNWQALALRSPMFVRGAGSGLQYLRNHFLPMIPC